VDEKIDGRENLVEILDAGDRILALYFAGIVRLRAGDDTAKPFGLGDLGHFSPWRKELLIGTGCTPIGVNDFNDWVSPTAHTDHFTLESNQSGGVIRKSAILLCPTFFRNLAASAPGQSAPSTMAPGGSERSPDQQQAILFHEILHVYLHRHPTLIPNPTDDGGDNDLREFLGVKANPRRDVKGEKGKASPLPYTHDLTEYLANGCPGYAPPPGN
jgi:hypothetical protein